MNRDDCVFITYRSQFVLHSYVLDQYEYSEEWMVIPDNALSFICHINEQNGQTMFPTNGQSGVSDFSFDPCLSLHPSDRCSLVLINARWKVQLVL